MAPAPGPEARPVFLRGCLVEGDPEFEKRARRRKRRALLISIVLQILVVTALVLFPLLSKGDNIAGRVLVFPSVPYSAGHRPHRATTQHPTHSNRAANSLWFSGHIPQGIVTRDRRPPQQSSNDNFDDTEMSRYSIGDGDSRGIPFTDSTRGPRPPDEQPDTAKPATVRRKTSELAQTALLTYRVEPAYPYLAIQLHREGRVELRAIISTEGSIESLEVISGDPLFTQSALVAVRQWRYRPTILDGQAIEVDTHITVIYRLAH